VEIVQVVGSYPPHPGGEEVVAERLALLQAEHHDVTVYTSDRGRGAAPRRHSDGRLDVFRDRSVAVGNTPVVPSLLWRLLRHRPTPDVVHVHAGVALTPEVVRLATRLRRVPYVAHLHLMVRPSSVAGSALLPLYQRTLYAGFLRGAARVVCLTNAMRDDVVSTFRVDPGRVTVVPNGVDVDLFQPGTPVERTHREVLFVGRLTAQKNVMMTVEAMKLLPSDVTLRIVGTGELHDALARRIADLRLPNVHLDGQLSPAELATRYRRADAVLMPSTHEGFPLVLLEAMASGAPVICSALPELVEAGGDAVVAIANPTADSLAATVREVLSDAPRRTKLAVAARRRAAGFGWPAVARAVDDVYELVRAERP
jgi:glycosyltransferase involved in cell wall biosynthesis